MKYLIKHTNSMLAMLMLLVYFGTSSSFMPKPQDEPSLTVIKTTKTITIKNGTNFRVDMIHLSPDEEDHWGDDILDEDEVLEPGESIQVEVDCGQWDVKLVAVDGSTCEVENINLCAATLWLIQAKC